MVLPTTVVLTCLLLGQAEPPPAAELAPQIRKLARQLNSDQLATRDAAEKKLMALGPAALDLLPRITRDTPSETKLRLNRIRAALITAAVQATTRATRVTLKGQEIALSKVLAAVQQQTGNTIVDYREQFNQEQRDTKLNVDFHKTPFWRALDQILDQAELTTYNYSGQQRATALVARQQGAAPRGQRAAYSGIFRLETTQIQAIRDLRNPDAQGLKLNVEITWEPRIVPIALSQPLADITALDEHGKPVPIDGRVGTLNLPVESSVAALDMQLPFLLPPRDVKRIASLQGKLTALVPGRKETFEFDQLADAKNVVQRKADVTVILQTVRKNEDVYDVRILIRFDEASGALQSHRGWIYDNQAYLIAPDGQQVDNAGYESTRRTANEVGLAYKFPLEDGPAGYKFVYITPAAIVKMPVEYELKNIDLP